QRGSAVIALPSPLDRPPPAAAAATVPSSGSPAQYTYSYTVFGPPAAGWGVDSFTVPLPSGTTVSGLVTPQGWSVTTGSTQVQWSASSPAAAITTGGSRVFGFTTSTPPGVASADAHVSNSGLALQVDDLLTVRAPVRPAGPALAQYYQTTQNTALNIAAPGVLTNDLGTGLTVTSADSQSAWGVPVVVNANGSFTYTPGSRFTGLSAGEQVFDS